MTGNCSDRRVFSFFRHARQRRWRSAILRGRMSGASRTPGGARGLASFATGRLRRLPLVVLAIALGLSVLLAWLAGHYDRLEAQRSFDDLSEQVQEKIAARMEAYIALLRSGAAFVSVNPFELDAASAAGAQLTRERFIDYVTRLRLNERYPGVQGYGLTVRATAAQLDALQQRMQAEGHEQFSIAPAEPREIYHAIVYLQPLDVRNRFAVGYDMHTDPVRREAMDRAADSAEPAMSGRVTLVQEITARKQRGFLIYAPLYRGDAVPDTVQERRERLQGFVYSPFRAADLFQRILSPAELQWMRVAIYDGEPDPASLLYDSGEAQHTAETVAGRFTAMRELEIAGRSWTSQLQSRPAFDVQYADSPAGIVLFGGVLISLLLFFLTDRESRALGMAARTMERLDRSRGALAESERRFTDMADAAPAMLWEADATGVRTYFNKAWLEFRGRTLAQEADEQWKEGVYPEDRAFVAEAIRGAQLERRACVLEYRLLHRNGDYRWVHERSEPRRNALGFYGGQIGSCIDISAHKHAEEELERRVRQRTAELEGANRELEAFSYSVSHDLRAPVRIINAFSTILLEQQGESLPAEARRMVERIRQGSIAMGQLIDDLLSFSRVGRATLNKRPVDVNGLVREVAQELCAAEADRDVHIEVADMPVVDADPALLRQVYFNLISNSLKFTRPRDAARIVVGARREERPVFYVRDNGVGFDPRYAHKIFGVFERLHSSEQFEGTGVGLALVQRIVERHGGRIWAEAEPDRYAAFYFQLSGAYEHGHA